MKAARTISTLILALLLLGGTVFAQNGNLAEQQRTSTVLGGTGLFNTFSTRTLCKGEFNFALFWNNFDRDPGDLDINQVPFNFTIGLTNRWELWVNWITWQQTTSRNPFLLSGYQLSASQFFGDPFTLLGPPVGGTDGGAAFFPGTDAFEGGILPRLGAFGQPIGFPSSALSPGGPGASQIVGLGPAIVEGRPGFYNELPFFGEIDFIGFDSLGRPILGPRESSNGIGDIYIGTKVNLIDPNKHWFSMALGGYFKIPISRSDQARARGRTSGEFEGGPILILGQETPGKRVRVYENIGYIQTGDPEENGVKTLDLRNKLLLNAGLSVGVNKHVELITELVGTVFVGGHTRTLNPVNPLDLNVGARFFLKDGTISFGGAYRYSLTNADTFDIPVFKAGLVFVPQPFFALIPLFDQEQRRFESGDPHGFVGYISIGSRKPCPPVPVPTCVLTPSATTVNRGDRLSLTTSPNTPGYSDAEVTYEYRWEVRDAQGRPVTVSGSGASVEVPTSGLPCGRYSVTTTVTASVPAVDCPSECVTTGQTTCTTAFEVTEPPCPTISCSVVATPSEVIEGDRVTLRVSGTGGGNLSYSWSTTAGSLSSTTGTEVTLDTTGISGSATVTVNVSTDATRCDQPCEGSSCSTTVTVNPPKPEIPKIIIPCGPIFFPFNSARINNEHKACLDEVALRLQADPRSQVVIDGHRDSSERVGISLTRANNARDYLVNEKGVDAARITIRNFSDTCPHDSGDPSLNRRVEFYIVPGGASMDQIDQEKRCAAGSSPQVVTTEEPAVEPRPRPRRRPVRRRRPGEPITMMAQPVSGVTNPNY